ncbi:hypothetical protein HDU93_006882, partial [Gonapodya sp. JEL0774]
GTSRSRTGIWTWRWISVWTRTRVLVGVRVRVMVRRVRVRVRERAEMVESVTTAGPRQTRPPTLHRPTAHVPDPTAFPHPRHHGPPGADEVDPEHPGGTMWRTGYRAWWTRWGGTWSS